MVNEGDKPYEVEQREKQKKKITKWFLAHAPVSEIQYVVRNVKSLLGDDLVYRLATSNGFHVYNKIAMFTPYCSLCFVQETFHFIRERCCCGQTFVP